MEEKRSNMHLQREPDSSKLNAIGLARPGKGREEKVGL
jgi:hypothetical protein